MFLVHVIPISRGITKERLTYFSKTEPRKGALVTVPLRSKKTAAIVEASERVRDVKTKLRQSTYPIRRLEKVRTTQILSPAFMSAVARVADYTASTSGAVLNILVPKAILDEPKKTLTAGTQTLEEKNIVYERLALQTDKDERFSTYRSLVREAFARKQSVLIIMPTLHDVEQFVAESEKGIQAYMFALHGGLAKNKLRECWNEALSEKHPVVIVGTGSALAIPRIDVKTIVIERESSASYKSPSRPFVDVRICADFLAREISGRILFGDSFLRIETLHQFHEGHIAEIAPLRFRPLTSATHEIIDMRNYKPTVKGKYNIVSRELARLVEDTRREAGHLFVWSARRGLSPITVCSDCGAVVTSSFSDAPMVLHKTSRGNIFFCHQNGEIRSANERCRACGGWKLVALGGGIQLVEEELKERFPGYRFFRIDSDVTRTPKKAREVKAAWLSTPGSVLLGTDMALSYLDEPVEYVAVSSIDSLLSIPDFKIGTKVFSTLLTLRSLALKSFLLQTRNPAERLLKNAVDGNLLEFYREEIAARKKLDYPPFSLFIKLTVSGDRGAVAEEMKRLEKLFDSYDFRIFSAFIQGMHGRYTSHGLIKVLPETWPQQDLLLRLRSLPPFITIHVDPESLL